MKKTIIFLGLLVLLHAASVSASETLHSFFIRTLGSYPPISERRDVYQKLYPTEHYQGSAVQNIKFLGYLQTTQPQFGSETLGSATNTPETVAFFEDSLATPITAAATSLTLVRGTDKHGNPLGNHTFGFVISEGTSNEELVLADCNGTACTSATRGVSVVTGTSTVAGAAKAHRRGDSVKITDAPILLFLNNVFHGRQNIESLLFYATSTIPCSASSPNTAICGKAYMDGLSIAGAADANETTKGIVELATGAEAAASTQFGSTGAWLVPTALISTSTPFIPAGNYIPVTLSTGLLSPAFMPTSSPFLFTAATNTFAGGFTVVRSTSTQATTTFLQVGGVASTSQGIIGALGVGVATTTQRNLEVAGNVYIQSGICNGCTTFATTSATQAFSTADNSETTATASCAAGKHIISGAFKGLLEDSSQYNVIENYPPSSTTWKVTVTCTEATCGAGTLEAIAICSY